MGAGTKTKTEDLLLMEVHLHEERMPMSLNRYQYHGPIFLV